MDELKISIIVPAYNCELYIKKCIKSIQSQTYKNTQIVIVDDMSTDNTIDIVNALQKHDSRIILITLDENSGSAVARQRGIDVSSGDLITFVDADDWYCNKKALSKIANVYKKTNADCIMFNYNTVHKYGMIFPKHFSGHSGIYTIQQVAEAKVCKSLPHWHYVWNKCYKGDLLRNGTISFRRELRRGQDVRFNSDFLRIANNYYVMKYSYFYDYNCANINQITRQKHSLSLDTVLETFKRQKEDLDRLLSDYITIGVSPYAIKGLYKNFLYKVYSILFQNSSKEYFAELEHRILNDETFNKIIGLLGQESQRIEKEVRRRLKINNCKQYIKKKFGI